MRTPRHDHSPHPPRPIPERPPFSIPSFRFALRVAASGREAREATHCTTQELGHVGRCTIQYARQARERRLCITWGLQKPRRAPGLYIMISFIHLPPSVLVPRLQRATVRIAKGEQSVCRKHRQQDGHRLLEADGPGERRPAQNNGREEAQLDAVGLVVGDAVAAEAVCWRGG